MGMKSSENGMLRGAVLGSAIGFVAGMLLLAAFPAVADPGGAVAAEPGDPLRLARINGIDQMTVLRGAPEGQLLRLRNTDPDGTALQLRVEPGNPPLWVSSSTRVSRLNADMVDGRHAEAFATAGHDHDLDYLAVTGKAADADLLDGRDSSAFLEAAAQAADSDTVDGFDANQLVRVAHAATDDVDEVAVFGGGAAADGDILSAQITAPGPGLLFIVAGTDSWLAGSDAEGIRFSCSLQVDDGEVIGSERYVRPAVVDLSHTHNDEEDCVTSGVQQVAAGSHQVDLHIAGRKGAALFPVVTFRDASLQVLFVPFDSTGGAVNP